jgi:DNA-binding transcriptional LysR family regulator
MPRVLELNDMVVFARVVREGSFTGAARALGIPKSTVSQRVARLEARLGVRLLQRTTRSVRCTDAGLAYSERCARIVAAAEEADAAASEGHGSLRGRIRVCATQIFAHFFLPSVVAEYMRAHPEAEVDVVLRDGPVDVVEEGLDLAIRVGRVTRSGVVARRIGVADQVLCASPAYARAHGLPRTPGELQRFECILYEGLAAVPATWRLERGREVHPVRPRGRLTVGSIPLAHRAALDGLGIATIPRFLCADDCRAGRLVPVLDGWTSMRVPIHVVYPTRRHMPGRVRAFLDLLVARFAGATRWPTAAPAAS